MLTAITTYLEERLKLKVNRVKSKVSRPTESTLLGFSFYYDKGKWAVRIAKKSVERIKAKSKKQKAKSKKITGRNNGSNNGEKILNMATLIKGWVNYFSIANAKRTMQQLDECVRTRLRMGLWKEWKNCKTRVLNLSKLKASKQKAYD